jgi:hypothetical protein
MLAESALERQLSATIMRGGAKPATLRAVTDCVIATAAQAQIDRDSLAGLAEQHHREDPHTQGTPK